MKYIPRFIDIIYFNSECNETHSKQLLKKIISIVVVFQYWLQSDYDNQIRPQQLLKWCVLIVVDKVLLLHTDRMIERQTIRRTDRQNSISTALSESGVTKIFNMKLIPSYIKMIISVMAAYFNSWCKTILIRKLPHYYRNIFKSGCI